MGEERKKNTNFALHTPFCFRPKDVRSGQKRPSQASDHLHPTSLTLRIYFMKHLIVISLALLMGCPILRAQDVRPEQPAVQTPLQTNPQQAVAAQPVAQPAAQPSRMELSFGYFSYNDVLTNMTGYAEAQKRITELRATYQQELTRSQEEFTRQYGEFIDGQSTFPENILLKRQKELEQLMESSLKFREEARQLLQEEEERVMNPLVSRLDAAVARLGMERGYAFILDTDKGSFPFVSGTIGTDVTADLIGLLQ